MRKLIAIILLLLPFNAFAGGKYMFLGGGLPAPCAVEGQMLTTTGGKWACGSGTGTGDVMGAAASSDGEIVLYSGVTGKALKQSSIVPSANVLSFLAASNYAAMKVLQGYYTSGDSVSFADATLTGASGLVLGVAGSVQGTARWFSNTPANNYHFDIYGANFAANLGWRLPAAAPGGSNYLLNVDADGTMAYTDPATFAPAFTSGTANYFWATPNGSTGVPSLRAIVAADIPTLNQNTTGSAAKWTTARDLAGNSTDGSANVAFSNKFIVQGTTDAGLSGAQFLGALGTGIVKNTTTTGVLSIAAYGDVVSIFGSGSCSGYLKSDGTCDAGTSVSVSDVAYDATTWDGVTTAAPSKNAIRDYLESKLPSGGDGSYKVVYPNNTAISPTASADENYFEANVFKINQNGTEYSAAIGPTGGQVSFTGPTAPRAFALPDAAATICTTIASNTATLATGAIASGACATAVTVAGSGIATTDVINWGFNGDPTGVTGYAPSANGMLTIIAYPTSGNANFKVCNNTSASITPGAITLNWNVVR